jgi:hypothetical protein
VRGFKLAGRVVACVSRGPLASKRRLNGRDHGPDEQTDQPEGSEPPGTPNDLTLSARVTARRAEDVRRWLAGQGLGSEHQGDCSFKL